MVEVLTGGNSNQVVRDGSTVIRSTGSWSPLVHTLLRHLTAAGFKESPVLLESSNGKERLTFIEGLVGNDPLELFMQSDDILIEAARLLRRYHDLTHNFINLSETGFQLPNYDGSPCEVICHNDFAPYNCVFRDGHLIGIIDFDSAAPGTRIWDIAYAVYRFVPLANDTHCLNLGWQPVPDRKRRLKLFCDAYALEDREYLIATVIQRLESLVGYMQRTSSNLHHIPIYLTDLEYIADHQIEFTSVL